MATPSLRPLSLGEILDAGIKVVTRHWKPLALCVVIPVLPLAILQVLILSSVDSEALELLPESDTATVDDFTTDVWVTLLTTYGFGLITFVVVNTVCFKAVADAWLGAEPNAGRSLRFGGKMAGKIILLTLVWLPVMALASIPCGIPAIWLGTVWSLSLAAVMFERAGPFKALGRSYGLIQNRFWATLLLILVSFLLVGILGGIVSTIPSVFAEVLASENELALAVANVVGTTLGNVITYPYSAAVLTILYFDQRVRKEGFDVQMLAEGLGQSFDPNAPIPAPLQPGPYAPPPQTWQPQGGQYGGGWNAPSYQDAPLRWGPGAQVPPDNRPPEASPWMRPAPGGPDGPPPGGPPAGPSRWAPPTAPSGPPPTAAAGPPPTGPGGSQPAGTGGPLWGRPDEKAPDTRDDEARWGRPSEDAAQSRADEARWGRPSEGAPATPDEEARWGRPPATPGGGLTSGSPLGDEAAPTDPLAPAEAPADPLPPEEEPPAWESRWGASSPFGESPWEDEQDKKDKDRADWQPPEEPRGPGGL